MENVAFQPGPSPEPSGEGHGPTWPPPAGAAPDWTIPQNWAAFMPHEHAVWDLLFARQRLALRGRAVAAFERGLDLLQLVRPGIPEFAELNERLGKRTGWTIVAVPGLVPDEIFFEHLRCRRFPAGHFIRKRSQLDYLEEPDVFHDVFGHVPLLADPALADFMQFLGEQGLEALARGTLPYLARLYWFTVEFGLAREAGRLAFYGAGLASSFGESRYALESTAPVRRRFELRHVLATPYRSDRFQQEYFVIDALADLPRLITRQAIEAGYDAIQNKA